MREQTQSFIEVRSFDNTYVLSFSFLAKELNPLSTTFSRLRYNHLQSLSFSRLKIINLYTLKVFRQITQEDTSPPKLRIFENMSGQTRKPLKDKVFETKVQ